jgi:hypothetical protein
LLKQPPALPTHQDRRAGCRGAGFQAGCRGAGCRSGGSDHSSGPACPPTPAPSPLLQDRVRGAR